MLNTNITPRSILKNNSAANNKTRKKITIDTSKNTFHSNLPLKNSMKPVANIPNTLTIYIQTQVPGSQLIKYTPSMTFPNIQSKVVYFDPLVKLSQSTINEIPKEYQVFEFFDKNFFKSLLLKSKEPPKTLNEATKEGIIDNNIQITLNNIFKKNSVFYINKNPYIITDYEWERGNWKIDTKISSIPTTYYGVNSIQYRKELVEQLKSAKAELNSLPKNVVVGPNFTPPIPITQVSSPQPPPSVDTRIAPVPNVPVPRVPVLRAPTPSIPTPRAPLPVPIPIPRVPIPRVPIPIPRAPLPVPNVPVPNAHSPSPSPLPNAPSPVPNVPVPNVPIPNVPVSTALELRNPAIPAPPVTALEVRNPAIPPPPVTAVEVRNPASPAPLIEVRTPFKKVKVPVPEETNFNTENVKINDARRYSADIHKFFNQAKYKDLVVDVYKNMNSNEKEVILSNVRTYSATNSSDVNTTYPKTVSASHVKPNTGNGDCLYISIAEAINDHNENATNENKNKITYLSVENVMYGISEPFTQVVVRTAVANYILNDEALLEQYLLLARGFADEMNAEVERKYQQVNQTDLSVSEQVYNSIIDHVYESNDNFFIVKNSGGNPPFKVTETTQEQIKYILSNSWADERIVTLMPKILNLTVIPIKKINDRLTIPVVDTTTRFYMFVYHNANHYEEIYFSNSNLNRTSIFDKTNPNLLPPSYILLLLYGSYYYPLYPLEQDNVTFLKDIFSIINKSVNKILELNNKKALTFATNFEKMFPSEKAQNSLRTVQSEINVITGGAVSNHYTSQIENNANISYYITITLNLYPGETPSFTESYKSSCSNNYSNLQKAWAELLGKKYNIQPDYNLLPHNYSKKILKQIRPNNKTRKQ